MVGVQINRSYIVLARESRGLNQVELAEKLGMSPANLSKIEQGAIPIDESYVDAICENLNYPKSFLYQDKEIKQSFLTFRKRDVVSAKLITTIEAQMNILRFHIEYFFNTLNFKPASIPILDVEKIGSPQKCAIKLRKLWNIPNGKLLNLTKLLESNGVIISSFTFGTDRVDSRCMLTESNQPVIFTNKSLLGDRLRFTLAFELGHLVMHWHTKPNIDRDLNHEANLFAAEFLMPEKDIKPDFNENITLGTLGELKTKWGVSMQSLLYRADDLGIISYNQKRYLLTQFNQRKIRKREPEEFDVPKEKPTLLNSMIVKYKSKTKENNTTLAHNLHINLSEFTHLYQY